MDEILEEHIATYLDINDATEKIGETQLFITACKATIAIFLQRKTNEAVTVECVATKIKSRAGVPDTGTRDQTSYTVVGIAPGPYKFVTMILTIGKEGGR